MFEAVHEVMVARALCDARATAVSKHPLLSSKDHKWKVEVEGPLYLKVGPPCVTRYVPSHTLVCVVIAPQSDASWH